MGILAAAFNLFDKGLHDSPVTRQNTNSLLVISVVERDETTNDLWTHSWMGWWMWLEAFNTSRVSFSVSDFFESIKSPSILHSHIKAEHHCWTWVWNCSEKKTLGWKQSPPWTCSRTCSSRILNLLLYSQRNRVAYKYERETKAGAVIDWTMNTRPSISNPLERVASTFYKILLADTFGLQLCDTTWAGVIHILGARSLNRIYKFG